MGRLRQNSVLHWSSLVCAMIQMQRLLMPNKLNMIPH
jgi:hypothetical protein